MQRIQVLISEDLKRRAKKIAIDMDKSLGQLVEVALTEYLDRVAAPEPEPEPAAPPAPRRGRPKKSAT